MTLDTRPPAGFFEKGLNVMEVASITGHKDLRMLQRYTHLRAEDLALKLG
jgi:site-specific recombinase XerD